jgi:hypothetical protein
VFGSGTLGRVGGQVEGQALFGVVAKSSTETMTPGYLLEGGIDAILRTS